MSDDRPSLEFEARARLQQLVDTSQDAVLFIDRHGIIVLANPATYRIFGYAAPDLEGADVRILMAEPYASEHRGYVDRYEATGERRAIGRIREVVAKRQNGQEFPIELSVTQLADEGDQARYGAFIRDVSDKARLHGELMERERMATVGTTAAMLVHEIGNPLNNLALQLQALRRRVQKTDDAAPAVEKVDSCLEEIERLSRLVQEFRALSGRRKLAKQWVRPVALIEAVLGSVTPLGPHLSWIRRFQDGAVEILVDADKIQQVLLNLCLNAVEAMPEQGTLTLHTRVTEGDYLFEITDTGVGIPPGMNVFEPFVTTKSHGTGLGLAICAEIVREHDGSLDYASNADGGTTFHLRLPRVRRPGGRG